jgi:hypothetical protein
MAMGFDFLPNRPSCLKEHDVRWLAHVIDIDSNTLVLYTISVL